MIQRFTALVVTIVLIVGTGWAQFETVDPSGAMAAMAALPERYRNGIIKVSSDNAHPNPENWYILARNADQANDIYTLTVSDGIIQQEKPSLDVRALFGRHTAIDTAAIRVDSDGAWNAAMNYCQSKGAELANVSYVLEQTGRNSAPVWSIWCYGKNNSYIGELQILATDGSVISSK